MQTKLDVFNQMAQEHGYEIAEDYMGFSVGETKLHHYVKLSFNFMNHFFTINTVSSEWAEEEAIEFQEEMNETVELMKRLNNVLEYGA